MGAAHVHGPGVRQFQNLAGDQGAEGMFWGYGRGLRFFLTPRVCIPQILRLAFMKNMEKFLTPTLTPPQPTLAAR